MAFRLKKRISEQNARKMILAMAFHGNHYNDTHGHLRTVSDIKAHYAQNGYDFPRVISQCRNFSQRVPVYENLIGAQWTVEGEGAVSRLNHITGEHDLVFSGDGSYSESNYWASFEISREDFDSAIKSGRWERFLTAVNAGIAAIEAFMNQEYMIRLRVPKEDADLRKDLETKMKTWPARLTGNAFDLSGRSWASFSKLKNLRDNDFQHSKAVTTGMSRKEHVGLLNEYKQAVPRLLFDLHVHFGVRCPSEIIRYAYYPEIEMESRADA